MTLENPGHEAGRPGTSEPMVIRVLRGNPDAAELAALAAVLLAVSRSLPVRRPAQRKTPRANWDRTGPRYRAPNSWQAQGARHDGQK